MFNVSEDVLNLQSYLYQNRRATETLEYISGESGLLIEPSVYRSMLEQGFDLDPMRDNKSKYVPQAMFDRLAKYAGLIETSYEKEFWDQAYALTLKAFVGDQSYSVRPDFSKDFIYSSVKDDKSSGAPEFRTKGEVLDKDYARMWRILEGKSPDPCVAYHRVQHGSDGPKQRLVWGYPQSMTMLEAGFARPLIRHYLDDFNSPMVIGKLRFKVSARMTPILNTHFKYGFDYSGFDSTINERLIRMAFSILRKVLNFEDEPDVLDRMWRKVMKYFIHTPIIMPDQYVYIKHHGVPSGSYFTQMVDSIVNYFAIQYAHIKLTGLALDIDKILVLGDDSLFASPYDLSVFDISKTLSELGLVVNKDKTHKSYGSEDIEFLGHTWKHGLVDRDPIEIAKRMSFPEKRSKIKDGRSRIIHRVYPYVSDAISAHRIIGRYSHGGGVPDRTYLKGRMIEKAGIGWKEHLAQTTDDYSGNERDFYTQSFIGIIK